MSLIEVDVESGQEKPILAQQQWFSIQQVAWLGNKNALIIGARDQPMSPYQLWRISYPQGAVTRLTNDMTEYKSLSLSRDGNNIVALQGKLSIHSTLLVGFHSLTRRPKRNSLRLYTKNQNGNPRGVGLPF